MNFPVSPSEPKTSSVEMWWKRKPAGRPAAVQKARAASSSVYVPMTLVSTKVAGAVDRAVDMALGGEVHDRVGRVLAKDPVECGAVADVGTLEGVERALRHLGHVPRVGGVGQHVEVHHGVPAAHGQPHHRRADEPRTARHQYLHGALSLSCAGGL